MKTKHHCCLAIDYIQENSSPISKKVFDKTYKEFKKLIENRLGDKVIMKIWHAKDIRG